MKSRQLTKQEMAEKLAESHEAVEALMVWCLGRDRLDTSLGDQDLLDRLKYLYLHYEQMEIEFDEEGLDGRYEEHA